MNMSTMTLQEMGKSSGAVSLWELFNNDSFKPVESSLDYRGVVELLCRGGWPGTLQFCVENVMQTTRDYITAVVEKDASKAAGINHDPTKLRLFLKSLARNSSTPARVATIQQDISSREGILISDKTLDSYMNALRKIYLLNEIPAFSKNLRSKTSKRIAPIRHYADVSLAVAALETDMAALTNDVETVGLLFESLAVHELCVYAQSLGATVYQYHDYAGFEVDAIVKLSDGRWGAIEIKLGTRDFDAAAKRLCELRDKAALAGNPPSFTMILTATSGASGTREDGVHVVALDCLGV
jgi:predicted AAA+ superfamily ATPase